MKAKSVCAFKTDQTFVYAARIKDREVLKESSSGGVFTAISDQFLADENAVVCAIYNFVTHQTEFQIVLEKPKRNEARGSKYMQSLTGNVFQEAADWLKANPQKKLLFVGMGCQTAGFGRFAEISGFRDRVTLMDIICHGSPSPMLWREYAERLENAGKMKAVSFKDKRNGWKHPTPVAVIGEKEVPLNDYVRIFYNQCALRPACHKCPYTAVERDTDITIGDYWGIEKAMPDFYDELGNSLILLHTQKGIELFDQCKEALEYRISNSKDCLQPNLIAPTPVSKDRKQFWREYHKHGIPYIIKKYGNPTAWQKIKSRFQRKIRKLLV